MIVINILGIDRPAVEDVKVHVAIVVEVPGPNDSFEMVGDQRAFLADHFQLALTVLEEPSGTVPTFPSTVQPTREQIRPAIAVEVRNRGVSKVQVGSDDVGQRRVVHLARANERLESAIAIEVGERELIGRSFQSNRLVGWLMGAWLGCVHVCDDASFIPGVDQVGSSVTVQIDFTQVKAGVWRVGFWHVLPKLKRMIRRAKPNRGGLFVIMIIHDDVKTIVVVDVDEGIVKDSTTTWWILVDNLGGDIRKPPHRFVCRCDTCKCGGE